MKHVFFSKMLIFHIDARRLKSDLGLLIGLRNMSAHGNEMNLEEGIQCVSLIKRVSKQLKIDPEGKLKPIINKVQKKLVQVSALGIETKKSDKILTFTENVESGSKIPVLGIVSPIPEEIPRVEEEKKPKRIPAEIPKNANESGSSGGSIETKATNKGCLIISRAELSEYLREERARKFAKKAK